MGQRMTVEGSGYEVLEFRRSWPLQSPGSRSRTLVHHLILAGTPAVEASPHARFSSKAYPRLRVGFADLAAVLVHVEPEQSAALLDPGSSIRSSSNGPDLTSKLRRASNGQNGESVTAR